jgi:hypothetical protein
MRDPIAISGYIRLILRLPSEEGLAIEVILSFLSIRVSIAR